MRQVLDLPVAALRPNRRQPRKVFRQDALEELASSIRQYGILQPITVRRRGGSFEIVAGERRLRAATLAGCRTVPCIVIEADDDLALELALLENVARADLNPMEEAQAYADLVDHGMSVAEISRRVGKSEQTIGAKMRLLGLHEALQDLVAKRQMAEKLGAQLARLDRNRQLRVVREADERRLTTDLALALVDVVEVEQSQEANGPLFALALPDERERRVERQYRDFVERAAAAVRSLVNDDLEVLPAALAGNVSVEIERLRLIERHVGRIRELLEKAYVAQMHREAV